MSDTLDLAIELIKRPSVTPDDCGCQALMVERLESCGFTIEHLRFDEVDNFWARRGDSSPLVTFAGHTDVVPPGPLTQWTSGPFTPEIRDAHLFGRGAADMKGSLAAMVTAVQRFVIAQPDHKGSIAFLITSDEEGPSVNGTVKVVEHLQARQEAIEACIVGEPSSSEQLGDIIKNGRRGSLGATLTIRGIQGHVAYPHLAKNPIHTLAPFLNEICNTEWDQGNEFFPPTTFQVSNINGGTGATNVIPETVCLLINFRYSTALNHTQLMATVEALLKKHDLDFDIEWNLSGKPFLTSSGTLVEATQAAIKAELNIDTELSTAGGTSDGRFIAPSGAQVIELGPRNATIHKINECVKVSDLDDLSRVYERILHLMLV